MQRALRRKRTESQDGGAWKGPLGLLWSNPPPQQAHPEQAVVLAIAVKTRQQTLSYSHWKRGFVVYGSSRISARGDRQQESCCSLRPVWVEKNVDVKKRCSSSIFLL